MLYLVVTRVYGWVGSIVRKFIWGLGFLLGQQAARRAARDVMPSQLTVLGRDSRSWAESASHSSAVGMNGMVGCSPLLTKTIDDEITV